MGPIQHQRQRRGPDLHLDRRHAAGSVGSGISETDRREDSLGPHRRAQGSGGRGRVPGLARRLADQRRHPQSGWRLDHHITTTRIHPNREKTMNSKWTLALGLAATMTLSWAAHADTTINALFMKQAA